MTHFLRGNSKAARLSSNVSQVMKALENAYKSHANAEKAIKMRKYARRRFDYYGLQAVDRHKVDANIRLKMPDLSLDEHHQLYNHCWDLPQREYQLFASELARDSIKILIGTSNQDLRNSASVVENMIAKKSWRDCVDLLAPRGEFNRIKPEVMGPIIDKWVTNKNVWLQRTAILHQLLYKEQTDQEKLFQYCLICAVEEDLVIKKAIGWALRNQFEVNPVAVKDFVRRNHFKLSKLSKREALKHA